MSNLRVYQQSIDVIGTMDTPDLRVYQQYIDVIGTVAQPGLRVSQQNVQVAGTISGDAQVSRVYLEVLTAYRSYTVEDTLTVTDAAEGVIASGTQVAASSTLSLSDSVGVRMDVERVSSTLSLSDDVGIQVVLSQLTSSSLSITDAASVTVIGPYPADNTLSLTQTISYIGPKWLDVDSTLVLTDAAREPETYSPNTSSTLSFTDAITVHGDMNLTVGNTLFFGQYADTILKIRGVLQELELTQTAVGEITKFVGNTLSLTSTVQKGITWAQEDQSLDLDQEVTVRYSIIDIGPGKRYPIDIAALDLVQEVDVYPYYARGSGTLELTQTAESTIPYSESAESELQYSEWGVNADTGVWEETWYGLDHSVYVVATGTKPIQQYIQWQQEATAVKISGSATSESITHTLSFNSAASVATTGAASSTLSLSQTATAVIGKTASDTLTLTDEATYGFVRNLAVSSDLGLTSSFTFISVDAEVCTFDPMIGSSETDDSSNNDPLPNILINEPTLTSQDTITLFYPWTSPTNTIDLRAPELGNKNRLEFQRINRKTRGGTLIVWADNQWPKNERMVIDVRGMSETTAQALLTFVMASLGQEIGITDWEGQTLRAVLLNPESPITRNKTCDNMASMEFEITWSAIDGASTSSLSLSDTAARELVQGSVAASALSLTSGSVGINT